MKKALRIILCLVPLLTVFSGLSILTGCTAKVDNDEPLFAVYIVQGKSGFDLSSMKLEDLILESKPLITEKDIKAYYWNEKIEKVNGTEIRKAPHTLELNSDIFSSAFNEKRLTIAYKPFVVTAKGKRIYYGYFYSPLTSMSAPDDLKVYCEIWPGGRTSCSLSLKPGSYNDPRKDKRIYDALKQAGKLVNN